MGTSFHSQGLSARMERPAGRFPTDLPHPAELVRQMDYEVEVKGHRVIYYERVSVWTRAEKCKLTVAAWELVGH